MTVAIVADAIANGGFDLVIVDEATHYKNAQTDRWEDSSNKITQPRHMVVDDDGHTRCTKPTRCVRSG